LAAATAGWLVTRAGVFRFAASFVAIVAGSCCVRCVSLRGLLEKRQRCRLAWFLAFSEKLSAHQSFSAKDTVAKLMLGQRNETAFADGDADKVAGDCPVCWP